MLQFRYYLSHFMENFPKNIPLSNQFSSNVHRIASPKTTRRHVRVLGRTRPAPPEDQVEASPLPFLPVQRTRYLYDRKLLTINTLFSKGGLSVFLRSVCAVLYCVNNEVLSTKNAPDKGRGQPNVFTTE